MFYILTLLFLHVSILNGFHFILGYISKCITYSIHFLERFHTNLLVSIGKVAIHVVLN